MVIDFIILKPSRIITDFNKYRQIIIGLPELFFSWIRYKLWCGLQVCLVGTSVGKNRMVPN